MGGICKSEAHVNILCAFEKLAWGSRHDTICYHSGFDELLMSNLQGAVGVLGEGIGFLNL